jgi:hypothetical protein
VITLRWLASLLLFAAPCTWAQLGNQNTGNVKVRIALADGSNCNIQARVQLLGNAGASNIGETFTNDNCQAEFSRVVPGNYHVVVSGQDIETVDSGIFEVDTRKVTQSVDVTVRHRDEANADMPPKTSAHGVCGRPQYP